MRSRHPDFQVSFLPRSEDPAVNEGRDDVYRRLGDLARAMDGFDADLQLANLARARLAEWLNGLSAMSAAPDLMRDAIAGDFPANEWHRIALRSAVMRVAGLLVLVQSIGTAATKGELMPLIDRDRLRDARRRIDVAFPDAVAMRNAVAHSEEREIKPAKHTAKLGDEIAGIQGGGAAWFVSDFIADQTLHFTAYGQPVSCELSDRTMSEVDSMTREHIDIFARIPGAWPQRS